MSSCFAFSIHLIERWLILNVTFHFNFSFVRIDKSNCGNRNHYSIGCLRNRRPQLCFQISGDICVRLHLKRLSNTFVWFLFLEIITFQHNALRHFISWIPCQKAKCHSITDINLQRSLRRINPKLLRCQIIQ